MRGKFFHKNYLCCIPSSIEQLSFHDGVIIFSEKRNNRKEKYPGKNFQKVSYKILKYQAFLYIRIHIYT